MRLSEFWLQMDRRFGEVYARSVAADFRLSSLGGTVDQALERGITTKVIWRAVCAEIEAPTHAD